MADMWLTNANALPDLCLRVPELWNYGFYRRLNDKSCPGDVKPPCYEFISFCDPRAEHMLGIRDDDLKKILDAFLPKKRGQGA